MRGCNKLILCKLAVMDAMQEYIDKRMPDHQVHVVDVLWLDGVFHVLLDDKTQEQPK